MKDLQVGDDYSGVLQKVDGGFVTLTLNRPEALNALDHNMIIYCRDALKGFANNDGVSVVCFKGAGERSFCAGGDIKAVYYEGQNNLQAADYYFYEEYRLNRLIKNYKKPLLSYMDGIVMGGGYGVAGPSRYRIATERTVFAMPEVGIGLFPDVGSMYSLTRCPGGTGLYLALTGYHIKASDMLYCGLADYYIPSQSWEECERALIKSANNVKGLDDLHKETAEILKSYSATPDEPSMLEKHRPIIDRCFAKDRLEDILSSLHETGDKWAMEVAEHIQSRCPKSVRITFEHYKRARNQSFDKVTTTDFTLVQNVLRDTEFYEGIRALLIDKDKTPRWKPDRLDEVTEEMVLEFFSWPGKALDDEWPRE